MIKRSFLFLILALAFFLKPINGIAQNYLWAKTIGAKKADGGGFLKTDAAGNVYVCGIFRDTLSFSIGAGVTNLVSTGGFGDIIILKLDSLGNTIWAKRIGGNNMMYLKGMTLDNFGNIYVTGIFTGMVDVDPGPAHNDLWSTGNGFNSFISKLNSSGNFIWGSSDGWTDVNFLLPCMSGNIYVAGSFGNSWAGNGSYIAKLDTNGNSLWSKSFANNQGSLTRALSLDQFENIYVTGYFGTTCDFDPGVGVYNLTSAGMEDNFISKFDSAGNFVWALSFGGSLQDYPTSIKLDTLGNIYTAGSFRGTTDFDPGPGTYTISSASWNADSYISKLSPSGNFIWVKTFGGLGADETSAMDFDKYGNIYTTGIFQNAVDFDPGYSVSNLTSKGFFEAFITKLDNNGNFVWAKSLRTLDSTGRSLGKSINIDKAGNIYTGGEYYTTVDFDPDFGTVNIPSAGGSDLFISKLGKCNPILNSMADKTVCAGESVSVAAYGASSYTWTPGGINTSSFVISPTTTTTSYTVTGIKSFDCVGKAEISITVDPCTGMIENSIFEENFIIYPNPSNGEFFIRSSKSMDLKIVNQVGQLILTIILNQKGEFSSEPLKLNSGVYFVLGKNGNKKIVVN